MTDIFGIALTILNHLVVRCPHCAGKVEINDTRQDGKIGIYCKKCKADVLILEQEEQNNNEQTLLRKM